jgi:hypothetical protein
VNPEIWGGGAIDHRRWRLPGEALIKLEGGVGLGDEVPVQHRIGIVVAWGVARAPVRFGRQANLPSLEN